MAHREEIDTGPSLTKIIATLGPASDQPGALRRLVECGATIFRLNFSHGSFEEHLRRLRAVRELERELDRPLAVFGDLSGPKIRIGPVPGEGIDVQAGQDLLLRCDIEEAVAGDPPAFACTYEPLAREVEPGHRVLIDDGAVRALAVAREDGALRCRVTVGGRITTGRGLNLPDSEISAPAITDRDWACVEWSVSNDLDYLALSFVRRGEEVRALKDALHRLCAEGACGTELSGDATRSSIPVIAKIEKPQAVERIDEILREADAMMVARGDLGVEMDLALAPVTQKRLIKRAQAHGRPCIVATEMLESMIENPSPTRAEVSDVANAIFDAADAVMLSGETAMGAHGPLAVEIMRRVARATEQSLTDHARRAGPPEEPAEEVSRTAALAHGAWRIVVDLGAVVVACWSQQGGTARRLSRMGFRAPVIAFSSDRRAVRRMSLLYGVTPVHEPNPPEHRSDFARLVDRRVVERGLAGQGDQMVIVAGKPLGQAGATDSVSVQTVSGAARR